MTSFTHVHIKETLPRKYKQMEPEFVDLWDCVSSVYPGYNESIELSLDDEFVERLIGIIKEVKQFDSGGTVSLQDVTCKFYQFNDYLKQRSQRRSINPSSITL